MSEIKIGVFGGTGFYTLLEDAEQQHIDTPYGAPSSPVMIGTYKGKRIAFIARHAPDHSIPPHKINYRANVWAMKSLAVRFILSPAAAGSLQRHIKPGEFVVSDQYIDRTSARIDTFYDSTPITHMPGAEPLSPELRALVIDALKQHNYAYHEKGTAVVIQGPRFSSKAESQWFTEMGWELINMTMYPEAHLAKEQEIAYANISLITDYDTGFNGEFPPVEAAEAVKVFMANIEKLKQVVFSTIERIDEDADFEAHSALSTARW